MSRVLSLEHRQFDIQEDHSEFSVDGSAVVWDAGLCLLYYLEHAGGQMTSQTIDPNFFSLPSPSGHSLQPQSCQASV